jgi:GntR family transcriptional regulator/MocR family aminotransferase
VETFRAAGARIVTVPLDANGLDIEAFEALCRRHSVKLVYLTPHHQFPTTRVMRPEKRLRLLGLAEQFRFAIVEDDYDHEFHFSHQPLLPLASVAPRKTIYVGSMSKLLTPSIRLGYVVAPALVIERMAGEVLLLDRQGDPATELAIAGLIDSGEVNRHARKSLQIYAHRRHLFSSLLRESIGNILPFEEPEGGLAFWIDIDGRLDIEKLNERANREGIQYLPPNSFAASPNSRNRGLRLGFASLNESELAEATRRLAIAVRYAAEAGGE